MDRNEDKDFDAWLAGEQEEFDAAMRESVDSAAVLRAIKHRSAAEARQKIDQRVAVAAATGVPLDPEPDWPAERWARVDDDFAALAQQAPLRAWSEYLAARHHLTQLRIQSRLGPPVPDPMPTWEDYGLDDAVLLEAIAQGRQGALERIVSLVRPLAVRYVRGHFGMCGRSLDAADDVAQDALISMLKGLPAYDYESQPFLRFAYSVLRHEVGVDDDQPGGNRRMAVRGSFLCRYAKHAEAATRFSALLRVLSAERRELVLLRIVVGLSAEETATALGRSAGWVRVEQHRALTEVRRVAIHFKIAGPDGTE